MAFQNRNIALYSTLACQWVTKKAKCSINDSNISFMA